MLAPMSTASAPRGGASAPCLAAEPPPRASAGREECPQLSRCEAARSGGRRPFDKFKAASLHEDGVRLLACFICREGRIVSPHVDIDRARSGGSPQQKRLYGGHIRAWRRQSLRPATCLCPRWSGQRL